MLPASRWKRFGAGLSHDLDGRFSSSRSAQDSDLRQGDSANRLGYPNCRPGCEQQFIVFASMEGLFKCCPLRQRKCPAFNQRVYARFFAQMGQVDGEAVAKVDGGTGEPTPPEG